MLASSDKAENIKIMLAEIICIGDELLIGQTLNTNATWLAERLNLAGVHVHRVVTIGDDKNEILSALKEASSRCKLILLTGGLGPTKDDITKLTLCDYFNTKLVTNEEALQRVTEIFEARKQPLLEMNRRQAELPEFCTVIPNYRGTASGMWFEKEGTVYISMPGVPYEMEHLMETQLLEKIRLHFQLPVNLHRTILTAGIGESFLAEKIEHWEDSLKELGIALAYLPTPGMVKLRMSAYEVEENEKIQQFFQQKESELHEIIREHIYGYETETLQEVVGKLLRSAGKSIATAESCTGGYLAHLITTVAGSSDYFLGGFITYSIQEKIQQLGVKKETIIRHGVVSAEVAEEMADKARQKTGSDWALSTTGIAGPGGGTEENPVGTVWIGLASPKGIKSYRFLFGRHRELNITLAAQAALNQLRKEILS